MKKHNGKKVYDLIKKLFPINRSITGEGNRKTLDILKKKFKRLKLKEYLSGTKVFDWTIPPEWNVHDAYVLYKNKKIIDFKKNNLHLVGYSKPFNKKITKQELFKHLYTDLNNKNAIPYITSYYKKNWGFCVSENSKKKIRGNKFKVVIDSSFNQKGSLTIGEAIIAGKSKKEILISCNICHPSMANNELSGPTLLAFLGDHISKRKNFYTYRILFLPETIGTITYLSSNLKKIKSNFVAGFHLTCIGDDGKFSMVKTKYGNSYSDEIALKILKRKKGKIYSFLDCGSDERQYNYPGINLPVVTLCRSKFGEFKEYHSSMDNLNLISPKSLQISYDFLVNLFNELEKNNNDFKIYSTTKCEPFMSKRGLYRTISRKNDWSKIIKNMFNILYYGDGNRVSELSNILKIKKEIIIKIAKKLEKYKLVKII